MVESAQAQLGAQSYGLEVAKKNFPALLAQAQAQLAAAKATADKAQADYNRQHSLSRQATSQQEVDAARAALQQAQAQVALAQAQVAQATPVPQRIGETEQAVGQLQGQVEQAQARLDQAELNLSWTVVRAPQDGWITKRNVEAGNYVAPGQQIFAIVAPELWVTANFKESQLDRMRPGQKVDDRGGRLSAAQARRPCRQHPAGLGREIHRLPAGKRHRQFRQDRAARAGQDRHRQRPRSRACRCRSAFPSFRRSRIK